MATTAIKKPAKKAAKKAGKTVAKKAGEKAVVKPLQLVRDAAEDLVRLAADRAADLGHRAIETGLRDRIPIQVSVDVAVPLEYAWDRWMTFEAMTEGVHRIEDVDRDGDYVIGHTAGVRGSDWEAEIVDEREHESFAWRSVKGSDCAGLVTFHRLSDRLTRLELDLDVLPTNPREAVALSLHLAHRHAEAELRRFKASVEFVNPDVYEDNGNGNGNGKTPSEKHNGDGKRKPKKSNNGG
jgi:uncharacterized membrane protein